MCTYEMCAELVVGLQPDPERFETEIESEWSLTARVARNYVVGSIVDAVGGRSLASTSSTYRGGGRVPGATGMSLGTAYLVG
jgi:hypothetical protein